MGIKTKAVHRLKASSSDNGLVDCGDYQEEATISFKIKGDAKYTIQRMLGILAYLGNVGASRTIIIEDVPGSVDQNISEGDMKFGFDGDGSDKITDVEINGQPLDLQSIKY